MPSHEHYDIIIIVTGAGGGTLVHKLAPSGKKILLLERGGYVPREKDNWEPRAVNLEGKYQTKDVWCDKDGKPLHPHTNYNTEAEQLYDVHGERGEDPTEPWASAPYPYGAVSHEPRIQHLAEDFARLGCKPFHLPLGIKLKENDQTSECIRCETCDGFPCLVNA